MNVTPEDETGTREEAFCFADDLGPAKIIHIHNPQAGLKAVVAVDNVAAGPAIGGIRLAPDVSTEEAFRLARAMTFKNAAAGLAHGGGKSVIFGDPAMPPEEKERLIRAFAGAIRDVKDYIPGPDMGTDERCMAWIHDEIERSVGLPRVLGGIPLDEIGATAYGLAVSAEVVSAVHEMPLEGARVAIQGFGSVGLHAARFLAERGCRIVAVSDSRTMIADGEGLDVAALIATKESGRPVGEFGAGEAGAPSDLIGVDCDIWIPAARPDAIRSDNLWELKAKVVLPGANIAVTAEAEPLLHDRGVVVVPDFVANAGGVICAAVEYHGGTEARAFPTIEDKIRSNATVVLERARSENRPPRDVALQLAEERVRAAMALGRTF